MRRILLTGATGFIGRHVLRRLQAEQGTCVACLVRASSNVDGLSAELRYGDLGDADSLAKALSGMTQVIHLAAAVGSADAEHNRKVNVEGSKNLIDACLRMKVHRVLYISSLNAKFGIGSYGQTKREAEELFLGSGLDVMVLRPGLVFGKDGKQFAAFVRSVTGYPFIPLVGRGTNLLQPIDVDDLAAVIAELASLRKPRQTLYEIGGRDRVSTRELLGKLSLLLGYRKRMLPLPVLMLRMAARALGGRSPVNSDQVRIMTNDLVCDNAVLEEIAVTLTPLDTMLERYLGDHA